jgi:hypothetical protein
VSVHRCLFLVSAILSRGSLSVVFPGISYRAGFAGEIQLNSSMRMCAFFCQGCREDAVPAVGYREGDGSSVRAGALESSNSSIRDQERSPELDRGASESGALEREIVRERERERERARDVGEPSFETEFWEMTNASCNRQMPRIRSRHLSPTACASISQLKVNRCNFF